MSDRYLSRAAEIALRDYPSPSVDDYNTARQYVWKKFNSAAQYLCRDSLVEIARLIPITIPDIVNLPTKNLIAAIVAMSSNPEYECIRINSKCINEVATRYAYRYTFGFMKIITWLTKKHITPTGFDFLPMQYNTPFYVCRPYMRSDGHTLIYMYRARQQFDKSNINDYMFIERSLFITDTLSTHVFTKTANNWFTRILPAYIPEHQHGSLILQKITTSQRKTAITLVRDTTPFTEWSGSWALSDSIYIIPLSRMFQLQAARGPTGILADTHQITPLTLDQQCIIQLERNNMLSSIPSHIFNMLPEELWVISPPTGDQPFVDVFDSCTSSSTLPWRYSD